MNGDLHQSKNRGCSKAMDWNLTATTSKAPWENSEVKSAVNVGASNILALVISNLFYAKDILSFSAFNARKTAICAYAQALTVDLKNRNSCVNYIQSKPIRHGIFGLFPKGNHCVGYVDYAPEVASVNRTRSQGCLFLASGNPSLDSALGCAPIATPRTYQWH